MKVPDFLKKGDRIGLFAPARKLNREEAEKAMAILKSWGLIPVLGKNIFGDEHQFSGTDEERAEDLHLFLEDPSIKAVIAFRGGYGCVRILPYLADHYAQAKWIIGYSDITVLHTWANQKLGWASLHATMPVNMIQEGPQRIESNESLRKALFGEPETLFVEGNHPQKEAPLCGGNLSVIYSLLGSDLQLNSAGKFLFLEDLDEYLYHVDRMMQAIVRSGIGSKAAAWLIGGMSDMRDNAIPFGADPREIISNSHKGLVSPLAFGLEAGHQALNRAMIFGIPYRLEGSTLTPRL